MSNSNDENKMGNQGATDFPFDESQSKHPCEDGLMNDNDDSISVSDLSQIYSLNESFERKGLRKVSEIIPDVEVYILAKTEINRRMS